MLSRQLERATILSSFFCLTRGEIVGRYAWRATPSRATLGSVIFVRRRGRRLLPIAVLFYGRTTYPIRGPDAVAVRISTDRLAEGPDDAGADVGRLFASANGLTAMATAAPPVLRSRPATGTGLARERDRNADGRRLSSRVQGRPTSGATRFVRCL